MSKFFLQMNVLYTLLRPPPPINMNTSILTQDEVDHLLAEVATGKCDIKRRKIIWRVFSEASQSLLAHFAPNHQDGVFQEELTKGSAMRSILRSYFHTLAERTPSMLPCLSPLFYSFCCRDVTNPDPLSGFDFKKFTGLMLRFVEITGDDVSSDEPHSSLIEMANAHAKGRD